MSAYRLRSVTRRKRDVSVEQVILNFEAPRGRDWHVMMELPVGISPDHVDGHLAELARLVRRGPPEEESSG